MNRPYGTIKSLAQRCGCHPVHMSDVLNGRRRPSAKLAILIEKHSKGHFKAWALLSLPKPS